jgi:hypothetical protein
MYDSYKDVYVGSMYSTDWTIITDNFEGNQHYLEEIRFFDRATRPVNKGDTILMLYDVNRITISLFNCSHLLYTVYSVDCILHGVAMVDGGSSGGWFLSKQD